MIHATFFNRNEISMEYKSGKKIILAIAYPLEDIKSKSVLHHQRPELKLLHLLYFFNFPCFK